MAFSSIMAARQKLPYEKSARPLSVRPLFSPVFSPVFSITLWLVLAVAHAGILWVFAHARVAASPVFLPTISASMFTLEKPDEPPKPLPVKKPTVKPRPVPLKKEPQVIAATPTHEPEASEHTAPPLPPPVEAPIAEEEAPLLSQPKFDADYLDNPPPEYPSISKRLGEAGRVVLRVYVEANGTAGKIEIRKSSGYARLDESAIKAVRRWKFVPARRSILGEAKPVGAWVAVPITFKSI